MHVSKHMVAVLNEQVKATRESIRSLEDVAAKRSKGFWKKYVVTKEKVKEYLEKEREFLKWGEETLAECGVEPGDAPEVEIPYSAADSAPTLSGDGLKTSWCSCENPEFGEYKADGECSCGMQRHHVHCRNCGCVLQVG